MNTLPPHSPPSKIRVIVADDHPVVLAGIYKILEAEPDIYVVACASNLDRLHSILDTHICHILICDYSFDENEARDGMKLIERIRRVHPDIKILMLTMLDDLLLVKRMFASGVRGFLTKLNARPATIVSAVRIIYRGDTFIDAHISEKLSAEQIGLLTKQGATGTTILSKREYEVVRLISRGMSVSEIARQISRSAKTISSQKVSAMKKLAVHNDFDLVVEFRNREVDGGIPPLVLSGCRRSQGI